VGNSLCLCRALSIYEFKSDRLLGVLAAAKALARFSQGSLFNVRLHQAAV